MPRAIRESLESQPLGGLVLFGPVMTIAQDFTFSPVELSCHSSHSPATVIGWLSRRLLPKELPPFNWINLTIDFDSAIPFVRWRNESSCAFEHTALRFLKKDVLKCFPATAPQRRGRK